MYDISYSNLLVSAISSSAKNFGMDNRDRDEVVIGMSVSVQAV